MVTRACLRYAREGQNVTQAGPKSHTSRAKMSHKGQNVTQSCYNLSHCIEWPCTNKTCCIATDLKRFSTNRIKRGDQLQKDVCKDHVPCNILRGMSINELFPIKHTNVTTVRLHHASRPSFIPIRSNLNPRLSKRLPNKDDPYVTCCIIHDDVIKWKHFPRYWPFVRKIHRSPVNFPHKGQWRGALMFALIFVWINGWVNNGEAGDLRRYRGHYDVIVMILWYHDQCESPTQM